MKSKKSKSSEYDCPNHRDSYWHETMKHRMPSGEEAIRLLTILKGFFLDHNKNEHPSRRHASLEDFWKYDDRPYGNKSIEDSIAFNLGWDHKRVLSLPYYIPDWVAEEANKIHMMVGELIIKENNRDPLSWER